MHNNDIKKDMTSNTNELNKQTVTCLAKQKLTYRIE